MRQDEIVRSKHQKTDMTGSFETIQTTHDNLHNDVSRENPSTISFTREGIPVVEDRISLKGSLSGTGRQSALIRYDPIHDHSSGPLCCYRVHGL